MIAGMTIYQVLNFFIIYSFLGWVTEVIYQAISKGMVINRGFLNGPVCPIYGFGVLAIFALVNTISAHSTNEPNAMIIFIVGVIIATAIELFGGWALDKIFHARWWDYSDRRFNLNGYICPEFSLLWGIGILLVVRVVHPTIAHMSQIHQVTTTSWVVLGLLYLVYFVDFSVSVAIMIGLNKRFAEIDEMRERMRTVSDGMSTRIGTRALESRQKTEDLKVRASLAKAEYRQAVEEIDDVRETVLQEFASEKQAALDELELAIAAKKSALAERIRKHSFFGTGRIIRSYPRMRHDRYQEILDEMRAGMLLRK